MQIVSAFLLGAIFAVGLGLGGMTQPAKIVGFLDVAGHWDPSLAFVMGGAVAVSFTMFPLILRQPHPLLGERFNVPARQEIDAQLLSGAAIFGVGWGLGGYCPGPALVSLASGTVSTVVFVVAMSAGLALGTFVRRGR